MGISPSNQLVNIVIKIRTRGNLVQIDIKTKISQAGQSIPRGKSAQQSVVQVGVLCHASVPQRGRYCYYCSTARWGRQDAGRRNEVRREDGVEGLLLAGVERVD